MGFDLRPACKSILTGNSELRLSERVGPACLKQVLGLVLQMPETGTIRERTRAFRGIGRHGDLLSMNRPLSAPRAERRFAILVHCKVGFCPFRGPDASSTLAEILSEHPCGQSDPGRLPEDHRRLVTLSRCLSPQLLDVASYVSTFSAYRKLWSGRGDSNSRSRAPKARALNQLGHSPTWWLVTELNRIHRLFRPALCRRVHEPKLHLPKMGR